MGGGSMIKLIYVENAVFLTLFALFRVRPDQINRNYYNWIKISSKIIEFNGLAVAKVLFG